VLRSIGSLWLRRAIGIELALPAERES
jgi:hypothetical protein